MEDFQREGGLLRRSSERQKKALVPNGSGGTGVVGLGGLAAVRVDPKDDVGLEIAVPPINVLQVLSGDDCDIRVWAAAEWWRWP